jgi:hypothetical protein
MWREGRKKERKKERKKAEDIIHYVKRSAVNSL